MKKSNIKLIMAIIVLTLFVLTWTVFIPMGMKSKIPGMTRYLEHEGYTNITYVKSKAITYTMYFNATDEKGKTGEVKVRFSKNGLYQIVY